MYILLPNSAHLQNISGFLRNIDTRDAANLSFAMNERWVSVHPAVLALTACAGAMTRHNGGVAQGSIHRVGSLAYLVRMKLFDHLGIAPPIQIREHEESGRFVPLTQIRSAADLRDAIVSLVPLLHAPPEVADPIKYVFSELVRNVLEHSSSPVGAFVCAQYYSATKRISIGVADGGIGIFNHMRRHHRVANAGEAIVSALQPGITGTTERIGGNAFNAGAGLFFTKSIAALSRNYFWIYSGNSMFRLNRGRARDERKINPDPRKDHHRLDTDLPEWPGTVVGLDLNVEQGVAFATLLEMIRENYFLDVKQRKNFAARIRFS